jgi:ABC-2 type transport system permease protein
VGAAAFLTAASLITGLRVAATPAALAGVLLYLVFMSGMGLASAGCVLVSKEGDPVSWAFGAGTALLGGVYFPVDLLPDWLRGVASLVPTTHALSLVRSGLGAPASSRPAASLLFLVAAAASSLGVGLLVLRWGHRRARRTGTLGEY